MSKLLYALVAAFGLAQAYWPTWTSGFDRMQAERGDSMHLNYVLEHQFRHLVGHPRAVGSYWSPGYFHPMPDGLAYSENLLGTLPIYALARLAVAPATAFQLWGMALLLLNFGAMLWALRRLGVRPWLAAAGGFVFSFALTRVGHLSHQHMLPHFAAPIALWAAVSWFEAPRLRAWIALWSALALQVLMSLHLGWFLLFALAVWFAVRWLCEASAWRRISAWLRAERRSAVVTVVLAVGLVSALLWPYAAARRTYGARDDGQVTAFAPRLGSWLAAPSGSIPAALGLASDPKAPYFWEHELFLGSVPLALGALALGCNLRRRERRRSTFALVVAVLVIFSLSLYVPRGASAMAMSHRELGWTLWWWVWDSLPGASGMRAVGRVWSAVLPLLVLGGWLALEEQLRRRASPPWRAFAMALMVLALAEQVRIGQPSFDKLEYRATVDVWRRGIPEPCRSVYFAIPASGAPWWVRQTTAMWAGLEAGKPTVNGYSSNYPPDYPPPERAASPEEVERWLRARSAESACYLTPAGS